MAEVVLTNSEKIDRFVDYIGDTRAELLAVLNFHNEGMARVIAFDQARDGTWYAVIDRALQVVLTMDDVTGIEQESENEDTFDVVCTPMSTVMSA